MRGGLHAQNLNTNAMAEKEILQQDKPLSLREKMTIHVVVMLIKVIKPFGWSHEIDKCMEEVLSSMKAGA